MKKEIPPPQRKAIGTDSVSVGDAKASLGDTRRMLYEQEPIEVEAVIQREENWDLRDWLSCLLRRKKTILIVASAIFLLSAVYTALQTPIYKSKAVLEIEKDSGGSLSNLGEVLTQGIGVADPEVFSTQIEILKGRTLVEALIDSMRLGESKRTEPGLLDPFRQAINKCLSTIFPSLEVTSETVSARQGLVGKVTNQIRAARDGKSRLISVSIDAESPQVAQEMLRKHVDHFLSQNLAKRRRVQTEAAEWATKEMTSAEKRVIESLANLVSFTTHHGVVSIDESTNHVLTFFQKAAENVVKTTENRIQVEVLDKEGNARAAAATGMKSPDLEQTSGKLALMESEYDNMKEIYSDNAPKMVLLRKQIEFLRNRISEEQKKTVSAVLRTAKQQEELSQEAFERAKKNALDNSSLSVQYAVLKKEAETNEAIYKTLLQKTKELQIGTQIIGNNIVEIAAPSMPASAVKPRVFLNLAIGCLLGLIAGVLAAFAQERLDRSVHDSRDLGQVHLANLGMVPNWEQLPKVLNTKYREARPKDLIAWHEAKSPLTEAFSLIKTSLFLTYSSEQYRVIMLTSTVPDDGKTTCTISLASSLAKSGKRVLVVDADMRRRGLSNILKATANRAGLSTVLASQKRNSYNDIIVKTPFKGLYLLPTGPVPDDAAGLLESPRMSKLMESLRSEFEFILIDSPPVTGLADSRILASHADGIVFVVKQGHASRDMIRSAVAAVASPRCGRILGTIFNQVEVSSLSRFGYGYASNSYYTSYGYKDYYGRGEPGQQNA